MGRGLTVGTLVLLGMAEAQGLGETANALVTAFPELGALGRQPLALAAVVLAGSVALRRIWAARTGRALPEAAWWALNLTLGLLLAAGLRLLGVPTGLPLFGLRGWASVTLLGAVAGGLAAGGKVAWGRSATARWTGGRTLAAKVRRRAGKLRRSPLAAQRYTERL